MAFSPFATANRYETILTDTERSRDEHYQFRYKVFCEETGFEQASAFPDKKERDGYDDSSAQFIVWDHFHQDVAGAMRLVEASETDLPIEDITSRRIQVPDHMRICSIEFSRLCIDRRYSRIHRDDFFGVLRSSSLGSTKEIRVLYHQEDNEILLRLVRAIIGWSSLHGKDFCYFLITKALARVLQRQKVVMKPLGDSVSHRGSRIPYVASISETHSEMKAGNSVYRGLVDACKPFVKASSLPIRAPGKTYDPVPSTAKILDFPAVANSSAGRLATRRLSETKNVGTICQFSEQRATPNSAGHAQHGARLAQCDAGKAAKNKVG